MANNKTRKSFAVATASALTLINLVGASPANAVTLTTAPVKGTSYGALLGSEFVLRTTVASAGTGAEVKYLVTGATAGKFLTVDYALEDSVAGFDASDFVDGGDLAVGANGAGEVVIGDGGAGVTAVTATPYVLISVGLDDTLVTTTTTITLTPFVDSNDDDAYDADLGEVKGSPVSITYYPTDAVTVTASASQSVEDAEGELTVSVGNVNAGAILPGGLTQLIEYDAFINGAAVGASTNLDIAAADFDSDANAWVDTHALTALAAGDIVTLKIYVGEETTAAKTLRYDLGDTDVDDISTIDVSSTLQSYFLTGADTVRAGDGNVTFEVEVLDVDDVGLAGQTVTWTIGEGDYATRVADVDILDEDTRISSGGKTLSNADDTEHDSISVTSVTNADGVASIAISYTDFVAGATGEFYIVATVAGTGAAASTLDVTADATHAYEVLITDIDESGSRVIEAGDSVSYKLELRDEYGLVPVGTYRVEYSIDGANALRAQTGFANFNASGAATVTVTDNSTDAGTVTMTLLDIEDAGNNVELEAKDDDGLWGNVYYDATLVGQDDYVVVDDKTTVASFDFTASSFELGTDAAEAIYGYSIASVNTLNTNDDFDSEITTVVTTNTNNIVEIQTYDADGLESTGGNSVTFAAAGVLFADEAETYFGNGSITVTSDSAGVARVYFESNKAGEIDVTVTVNGKTDTLTIEIANSDNDNDVAEWTKNTALDYVKAGSTVTFKATATDEWGNFVDQSANGSIKVTYSGPGFAVQTLSSITQTEDDGSVTVNILLGANDTGTGTITVRHYGADDLSATSADKVDDVVVTYTFNIGSAPVVSTGKVNVGSFNGKLVVYAQGLAGAKISWKVGGKWGTANAVGNTLNRFDRVTPKKGVTVNVDIYVNGVKTLTKSVVTR